MAAPITWRNVNAPSNAGANQLLTNSTDQMGRGLDTIARAGQGFVDRTRAGEVAESAATSQDFINQISNLDSEQLATARQDGSFAGNNVAGLSAQDQQRVFAQLQGRDSAIANEQATTFAQAGAATARQEAPERQEIGNLIASEKYTAARKLLAASGIGDKTALSTAIDSGNRAFDERAITEGNRVRKIKGGQIVDEAVATNATQRAKNKLIIAASNKEVAASTAGVTLNKDGSFNVSETQFVGANKKASQEALLAQLQARSDELSDNDEGFKGALTDEQIGLQVQGRLTAAGITGAAQGAYTDTVTSKLVSNANLAPQAQNAYASRVAADNQQAEAQFSQMEAEHQALVALNPTSPEETARLEATTLNSVYQKAMQDAPQGSWMDGFSNAHGGEKLQQAITEISSQSFTKDGVTYDVKPWMIESALMGSTQTSQEAWGNPTTDVTKLKALVRIIATDPEGKLRKEKVKTSLARVDRARLGKDAKKRTNAANLLKEFKANAKIKTGTTDFDAIMRRRNQL